MVELSSSDLNSIFQALSDATRREILRDLLLEGKSIGQLAKPHNMSLAAVSKHVHVLERAKLVERERKGQFQIVRLVPVNLRAAQDWLTFYETFWSERLDALQTMFETQPNLASTPTSREESYA